MGYRSVGVDGSDGGSDSESDGGSTAGDDRSDGGLIEVNDLGNLKGERLTEGCGSTTGASSGISSVCSSLFTPITDMIYMTSDYLSFLETDIERNTPIR